MEKKIYQLLYLSTAATLYNDQTLEAILEKSRKNNSEFGVTGVLLYYDGAILQLLEGERPHVENTYTRILEDDRHHSVTTIVAQESSQRDFATWSMGFRRLSSREWKDVQGYLDEGTVRHIASKNDGNDILHFIASFYKTNFR